MQRVTRAVRMNCSRIQNKAVLFAVDTVGFGSMEVYCIDIYIYIVLYAFLRCVDMQKNRRPEGQIEEMANKCK